MSSGLSGNGPWRVTRDRFRLGAQAFRLEISDSHIIRDLMNLTVAGRSYYRSTRSEVPHGYVVAEVFDTSAPIDGTRPTGGRNVTNRLIFKVGGG